jgi:hypothetical protein
MASVMCGTCGVEQRIFDSVTQRGVVHIPKHRCTRYLVAEFWRHGERLAWESSEYPGVLGQRGVSGRQHLVRLFRGQAVDGWRPPAGAQGWTAYWVQYDG